MQPWNVSHTFQFNVIHWGGGGVKRGNWKLFFLGSCLKTGQHSIFVIIRKIKKLIHVCWIPQIDDFIFIMEQYFHY